MWLANRFASVRRLLAHRDDLQIRLDASADTLPLPPGHLRLRVGIRERSGFLRLGAVIAQDLFWLLDTSGYAIGRFRAILDFGCGCGRVARWMPQGLNFTGCDTDEEAIQWCGTFLAKTGRFRRIMPAPPTPFADGAFDFVYAISVFTHFTADHESQWLRELARVTQPGGVLLASSMDASFSSDPAATTFAGFTCDTQGMLEGYPPSCCNSYHTREYIEQNWTEHFEIVRFEPRGINHHQDAVLMRRR